MSTNDYETCGSGFIYVLTESGGKCKLSCKKGNVVRLIRYDDYAYWFAPNGDHPWYDLSRQEGMPGVINNHKRFETEKAAMWLWLPYKNDICAKEVFESYFLSVIKRNKTRLGQVRLVPVR